ncbi:rRNA maturation RNase YbeY [Pseudogemmatithrix spongiicola]|uniref:Endoribonuclease YbeY n=1 Tax=Pseudogemmatithrix spongiicola TaxID=3062599 RepID=A0AA49K041_9BACT|nr:rRNA maturation RNase YbeY [Gemmatimonadaceae bacterium 'strain 138']WKW15211.1 rRNA maturation RNase YbeY [Gemmatimonadaceae bacterium 'strain 318']
MSLRRPKAATALRVVVNREGLRVPVASARLGDAVERVLRAEKVRNALVSVTLMTPRQMAALNREHLGHSGPTDIITFGFRDPAGAVIGDVYICPAVAQENAKAFGVPLREELLRLAVHGALHVLGYEHPEGEARTRSPMWKRQERLLRQVLAA